MLDLFGFIREKVNSTPIRHFQIDPNGICGCHCWFCPSRYYSRRTVRFMSIEEFDGLLKQIMWCVDSGLVSRDFSLWLSSYNDILYDPLLPERLELLRRYGLRFSVLTNGHKLLLTSDLLDNYRDVVSSFLINLPAGTPEDYELFTLRPGKIFYDVVGGLERLSLIDSYYYGSVVSVVVNGAYDDKIARDQLIYPLPIGSTDYHISEIKKLFPWIKTVYGGRPLCDRAGLLREMAINNSVSSVRSQWQLPVGARYVSVCNNADRLFSWVHVTCDLKMYGCCQDFLEETIFCDLNFESLDFGLRCDNRIFTLYHMMTTMCLECWFSA